MPEVFRRILTRREMCCGDDRGRIRRISADLICVAHEHRSGCFGIIRELEDDGACRAENNVVIERIAGDVGKQARIRMNL